MVECPPKTTQYAWWSPIEWRVSTSSTFHSRDYPTQGPTHDMIWHCIGCHGMAWHGMTGHGMSRPIIVEMKAFMRGCSISRQTAHHSGEIVSSCCVVGTTASRYAMRTTRRTNVLESGSLLFSLQRHGNYTERAT